MKLPSAKRLPAILTRIYIFSSYLTENKMRLDYTDQPVSAVILKTIRSAYLHCVDEMRGS